MMPLVKDLLVDWLDALLGPADAGAVLPQDNVLMSKACRCGQLAMRARQARRPRGWWSNWLRDMLSVSLGVWPSAWLSSWLSSWLSVWLSGSPKTKTGSERNGVLLGNGSHQLHDSPAPPATSPPPPPGFACLKRGCRGRQAPAGGRSRTQ
jgi:hypothetical protein